MRNWFLGLSAVSVLACAGGRFDSGLDSGDSGRGAAACQDAPTLPTDPTGYTVGWRWDDQVGGSVSDTVAFTVPEGTVSLAATMDAGTSPVAWRLVRNGSTWVDLYNDPDWGGPPFKPSLGVASTVVLPNNEATWPQAGCLRLQAVSLDNVTSLLKRGHRRHLQRSLAKENGGRVSKHTFDQKSCGGGQNQQTTSEGIAAYCAESIAK